MGILWESFLGILSNFWKDEGWRRLISMGIKTQHWNSLFLPSPPAWGRPLCGKHQDSVWALTWHVLLSQCWCKVWHHEAVLPGFLPNCATPCTPCRAPLRPDPSSSICTGQLEALNR